MAALVATLLLTGAGCGSSLGRWTASRWISDYDTAETQSYDSGRELVFFYRDTRHNTDAAVYSLLNDSSIKSLTGGYVRCMLFKSYEPDRRYVAQYGVERAPALIVVHADGTYHALSGSMTPRKMEAFLAEAKPPGLQPVINPHLPRRSRYSWHRSFEEAHRVARQTDRPILVVFERTLSRDWQKLEKLLHRREVYNRFADMAHCRIGLLSFSAEAYITRFGALRLPAIVISNRDGTFHVLEIPTSYEAVVRFADAARRSSKTTAVVPTRQPG